MDNNGAWLLRNITIKSYINHILEEYITKRIGGLRYINKEQQNVYRNFTFTIFLSEY